MPDKAIDLVDEACANVRVQLDSVPEEIDVLRRQKYRLEVEERAISKEKDKVSPARQYTPSPTSQPSQSHRLWCRCSLAKHSLLNKQPL